MQIGIDAGALCGARFGTNIFTQNIIKALMDYDNKNKYILYSFCDKPKNLILKDNYKYKKLLPKKLWMSFRVSLAEMLNSSDVFLSLNQATPYTKAKIISFSHGLSFMKYKNSYNRLKNQLDTMIKKSKYIIVSSEKVKAEMLNYGALENQIRIINFGIPYDFIKSITRKPQKYFLFTGINYPIKNIDLVVKCFQKFSEEIDESYKLFLITNLNKEYSNKNIYQIKNISRKKLKEMYANAAAYLSASYYESFNFPVLEALSQRCPVIALKSSIIPEMTKYVNLAENMSEFISLMDRLIKNKTNGIDISSLKKQFNWKNYALQLCSLY